MSSKDLPQLAEEAIAQMRTWLVRHLDRTTEPSPEPSPDTFDVDSVLRQFIGLRQEVKLQTQAVRSALERLEDEPAPLDEPAPSNEKSIKAFLDVYDALSLASKRVGQLREDILPKLERLDDPFESPPSPLISPFDEADDAAPIQEWEAWAWKMKSYLEERLEPMRESARFVRRSVEGMLAGYQMSLTRLERLFVDLGLEAIPTVGLAFDPELMEIAELVPTEDAAGPMVLEEVRRGYRLDGRLIRFAHVKVAKSISTKG